MNHILNIVRKCIVMEYVYVIKLLVVMLMDTNVATTVIYTYNGMGYCAHAVGIN
jgi:hypothetical protein